tara:strand:+ start:26 stop:184 length:159 start_codon:yes stop_codon:yes gene_type:complete
MKKIYVCAKCRKILREELKNKYPIMVETVKFKISDLEIKEKSYAYLCKNCAT